VEDVFFHVSGFQPVLEDGAVHWDVSQKPMYNVVGVVKNFFPVGQTNFELRESGAGSRAAPRSGTFIEDP
jgi:hypothetical protein